MVLMELEMKKRLSSVTVTVTIIHDRSKLWLTLDVRNVHVPIMCQDKLSQIAYWGEKKSEVKPRYRIHELSSEKHFCILP